MDETEDDSGDDDGRDPPTSKTADDGHQRPTEQKLFAQGRKCSDDKSSQQETADGVEMADRENEFGILTRCGCIVAPNPCITRVVDSRRPLHDGLADESQDDNRQQQGHTERACLNSPHSERTHDKTRDAESDNRREGENGIHAKTTINSQSRHDRGKHQPGYRTHRKSRHGIAWRERAMAVCGELRE